MKKPTIREQLSIVPPAKELKTVEEVEEAQEAIRKIVKNNGRVWTPLLRQRDDGLKKRKQELLKK